MSEQKHTPEPWTSESEVIYQDYGDYKAYLGVMRGRETMFPTNEANAARIVECVNALAGIENPAEWVRILKEERVESRVSYWKEKAENSDWRYKELQSENERLKAELAKLKGETPC